MRFWYIEVLLIKYAWNLLKNDTLGKGEDEWEAIDERKLVVELIIVQGGDSAQEPIILIFSTSCVF